MAYDICYGAEVFRYEIPERKDANHRTFAGLMLILVSVAVTLIAIRLEAVQNFLIPGDKAVTKVAFTNMITDIRDGEPVADAVVAFCSEIIDHGKME